MKCDCGWECGILYVKRLGSKNSHKGATSGLCVGHCLHNLFSLPAPTPTTPFRGAQAIFRAQLFTYNTPHSQPQSHFIPTRLWRWNRQSVPKRWHLNYRRREMNQKKAYDIQNTAKVLNQGSNGMTSSCATTTTSRSYSWVTNSTLTSKRFTVELLSTCYFVNVLILRCFFCCDTQHTDRA
jgi:hypothetical protein